MTTTKHTTGPWKLGPQKFPNQRSVRGSDTDLGSLVAYINEGNTSADANAALIAASPALLEAATNLLAYLPESTDDFQNKLEAALVAAIAQARGEK